MLSAPYPPFSEELRELVGVLREVEDGVIVIWLAL